MLKREINYKRIELHFCEVGKSALMTVDDGTMVKTLRTSPVEKYFVNEMTGEVKVETKHSIYRAH